MALVTVNQVLGRNKTAIREGYHNVFYDYVLSGLKSTLNNEFKGADIYIAPQIKTGSPPFSMRLWGDSADIEQEFTDTWMKRYFITIDMYSLEKNANENFYKQFYADMEHVHQLIFNNKTLKMTRTIPNPGSVDTSSVFHWIDAKIEDITVNDFEEDEEEIDGLHKATFSFSCLVERTG